ncbi:MAG: 4Fe-4S binding protein [Desulfovibrio sp.]|uniref:4Fe-4S binding protein n=1 Tax=Desulfovibrio sp. 7SRBS1 TaxID=3378064 RepID=UPI003B3C13F1
MKVLRASRMDRCIGCHSCSLACARLVHKKLSWSSAGIRIRSSGGITTGYEARLCLACDPAPCAIACPTEALTNRKEGGVKVKKDLCIRCGKCIAACPVDAIAEDELGNIFVCIHCGRCVQFCPHGCLELIKKHPHVCQQGTCLPDMAEPPTAQPTAPEVEEAGEADNG